MGLFAIIDKVLEYAPKVVKLVKPLFKKQEKPVNPLTYKDVEHIQQQIKSATKGK